MSNMIKECQNCKYNQTKKSGGFGKLCNGYTMTKFGRCPEWRISEIIEVTNSAYNRNIDYTQVFPSYKED